LQGDTDRFLEHALILALIRIGADELTARALQDENPQVRRAVLIALDQMEHARLSREQVIPLLDTDDVELRRTVLRVITRHSEWTGEISSLLRGWLSTDFPTNAQGSMIQTTLVALLHDQSIQTMVGELLGDTNVSVEAKLLILESIAQQGPISWPVVWTDSLRSLLHSSDSRLVRQALATVAHAQAVGFDDDVRAISSDSNQSLPMRITGYGLLAEQASGLDDAAVDFLLSCLDRDVPALNRLNAASALGAAKMTAAQAQHVALAVAAVGPLELPSLLPAFHSQHDREIGAILISSLRKSPGFEGLNAVQVSDVFESFDEEIQLQARPLIEGLLQNESLEAERLIRIEAQLLPGNPEAGKKVFFGTKAACSACHRVHREGGEIGPNLSEIAKIRTNRDLLESIVFPSATLARDYETYTLLTTSGSLITGTIQRETGEAVFLRTAQRTEIGIDKEDIQELKRSSVSIMPQGLDATLTASELNDLLSYLRTLK
jgi:putative heme-binding domain-containing protein